jgi:hypothetical protein
MRRKRVCKGKSLERRKIIYLIIYFFFLFVCLFVCLFCFVLFI